MPDLQRLELVRALIALDRPLEDIVSALRSFDWDYVGPPVLVQRSDLISILKRYVEGELDRATVMNWAEALECRDEVEVDERERLKDEIETGLHDLANPEIQGPLTRGYALALLRTLKAIGERT
jgi:hypothetical protein